MRHTKSEAITKHHEFPLPEGDVLRLALISDTHSVAHESAAELIAESSPDLILHAGDIGDTKVLSAFEAIAPTMAVRGNIDGKVAPDVVRVNVLGPGGYELRILVTHIALYGPKLRRDARELARKHKAHLLVCGHSHVPFLSQEGETVIFNPGSIGPRRYPLPISFGLMELGPGHTKIRHVDCETGETWMPPG